jgi:hypothetical protein
MKTFESCNRVWLTMPEDGKRPAGQLGRVRILTRSEQAGGADYSEESFSCYVFWSYPLAGWYSVHTDGTDDHETAKLFITKDTFTTRLPRKREIRRRFKLSAKRSIIKHHP